MELMCYGAFVLFFISGFAAGYLVAVPKAWKQRVIVCPKHKANIRKKLAK